MKGGDTVGRRSNNPRESCAFLRPPTLLPEFISPLSAPTNTLPAQHCNAAPVSLGIPFPGRDGAADRTIAFPLNVEARRSFQSS
jgi:hypothetical protein